MRVYLPGTTAVLTSLLADGELRAAGAQLTGFAVTPGLRAWYQAGGDEDELEYAAFGEAARASLRLLGNDEAAPRRRVVLSVEIPDAAVTVRDDLDAGVVRVASPVPAKVIEALHIDDSDATDAVALAASNVDAADLGDEEATEAVDDAEGFELSWYAPQELAGLVASFDLD